MNLTKQKDDNFSFNIKGIELLNFNLVFPTDDVNKIRSYKFNINAEQKINLENKLIFDVISVEILNEDTELKLGSIKVSVIYEINNHSDFIEKNTQQIKLPNNIIAHLNDISISTTRGVMFSQFKGTHLHNAFLPVIDLKQKTNLIR